MLYLSLTFTLFSAFIEFSQSLQVLIFLILLPISIKSAQVSGQIKYEKQIDQILNMSIQKNIEAKELKQLIDLLLQESRLFHDKYKYGKGIIFESIQTKHAEACKQPQFECFCHKYQNEVYIKQQDEQDCEDRQNYLIEYIYSVIKEISLNKLTKQNNKIMLCYIYYSLQILKNPIKCLQSYYQLIKSIVNKQSTSIFDLITVNDIKKKISETFNQQFFKFYSSNQFIEIYEVIIYEKKKKSFEQKMIDCINLTIKYYNFLQNNTLNYSQIELYSKNLLKQKSEISEDFQFLSKFAEHNESIVFMGSIYLEAFDQDNQTILKFFQGLMRKDRLRNSQFQQQESINPSDGVLFCSLLDKGNKISEYSYSFITLLNIQHPNIINYDISTFLPTEKQVVEELLFSLHNANSKLSVLNSRDRFGFGINEKSQIVQLNITTKIQYLNEEVGICILVKQVNIYNNYILLSRHNQIKGITKTIYEQLDDVYDFKNIIDSNIEDHIPCLKSFDYQVGVNLLQNTIFVVDLKNKQVELTPLLSSCNVKQTYEQYLIFDISFKYNSVRLENQKDQFNYLDVLEFKLIQKEHDILTKINQLKNIIEHPQNTQMDKSRYMASLIEVKTLAETKFVAETNTKSFIDFKNDFFDINGTTDRYQYESKQIQLLSEKKIQFQIDNQIQLTSQPQLTSKLSNIQKVDTTNREQSPRYLSTFGQNFNEEVNLQSPKLTDNQFNDANTLTTRDLKTVRYMLDPQQLQQQQQQFQKNETPSNRKSELVSKSHSDFQQKQIQQQPQQVSNKGSSLNSQTSTYKNRIPKKISQKRMACNLRYFTMIGLVSLFQLIIVNWVVYQISRNGIKQFKQQFLTINNPMSMYMKTLDLLRSISYYYLIQDNDKTNTEQIIKQENKITKNDQAIMLQSFKDDFYNLIEAEDNQNLLSVLSSIEMVVYELVDMKVTTFQKQQFYSKQSNLLYTLKDYLTSSINVVYFGDNNRELGMWQNIIQFKQKIFTFQDYMKQDMVQVLEQCQMNNIITLIVVVCSSVFLVVVVLVVIYVQQMQKKKILSLLGCFTPDILSGKAFILHEQIFEYQQRYILNIKKKNNQIIDIQSNKNYLTSRKKNDMSSRKYFKDKMRENKIQNDQDDQGGDDNQDKQTVKFKKQDQNNNNRSQNINDKTQNQKNKQINVNKKEVHSNQNNKNQIQIQNHQRNYKQSSEYENQNKRKRIQASFDKYQALNFHHFAIGLLMICILNCQSIVNIIIFEPYQQEQKWLIDEKLKIYDLGATVTQIAAPEILNFEWLFRGYSPLDSIYMKFINSQIEENEKKLLLVKTLATPASITVHDKQEYDHFYMQTLSGNICKARQDYPKYINSNFTIPYCNSIYQGILTKGFLFAINKAYQEVYSIQEFYIQYKTINNTNNQTINEVYAQYSKKFINGHNLIEVNSLLKFVSETIQSISMYYHQSSDTYTGYMLNLFFMMFIMQIILVLFLVIFIWLIVNKKLKNEMNQTKSYFSLFNSRILSTNSPLNQYFTDFSQ